MGGSSAEKASSTNPAFQDMQSRSRAFSDPTMRGLMAQYGQGKMSLSDVMGQANGLNVSDPNDGARSTAQNRLNYLNSLGDKSDTADEKKQLQTTLNSLGPAADQNAARAQFMDNLATDPLTGSKMASEAVQNDKVLGAPLQNLGQDMNTDRQALLGQGEQYGLTDQDLKSYGQASGNVSRMFANQDQNLSQSLADRGLASGANGAAGQAFTNSYGNKLEQLAGLQTQIAQNRINTAQGLAQFRMNSDMQRAQMGQNAVQQQYGRQLSGAENNYNQQQSTANTAMNNQNLQQNINNSLWQQQESTRFHPEKLASALGGAALGALTGGAGAGLGSSLGSAFGGAMGGGGGGMPAMSGAGGVYGQGGGPSLFGQG